LDGARRLGCSRNTVRQAVQKFEICRKALFDAEAPRRDGTTGTFYDLRGDPTGRRKYTVVEIAQAIILACGNVSDAARRLGCGRQTVIRAVKEHKLCQRAVEEAEALDVDFTVSRLTAARHAGEPWAIKFFLSSAKAARHGYGPAPREATWRRRRSDPVPRTNG
jgi:transposase-like protein